MRFLFTCLCVISLYANKPHIAYLMQSGQLASSIEQYAEYRKTTGRHDFELLQQMAIILLEQGARSQDPEKQLLSMFGSGIASFASSVDILESGITSPHPETQMASIQFLGRFQDDRCEELLTKAMASNFFFVRMEAAYLLAARKSRTAVGQIEALMYRVPPYARFFFPEFFALIGTSDGINVLKRLIDDPHLSVRIEAILSAARFGRDDLLPLIRSSATHLNMAEQEACATALGALKDTSSLKTLEKLKNSPSINIQLAACRALYQLGILDAKERVLALAKEQNLFAIHLLGDMPGSEDTLATLLDVKDPQVHLNAAIALLKLKDARCSDALIEILIRDSRDIGFQPQFSIGRSLIAFKPIPSMKQHLENSLYDLQTTTLSLREQILRDSLELPEAEFLKIARALFDSRQSELIPLLVTLLENHQTENSLLLLKQKAHIAGAPLIRMYCTLALFRLGTPGPYEAHLRSWIEQKKNTELIKFRPMSSKLPNRFSDSAFDLTPEENSRLLIDAYLALAEKHDEKGIDALLEMIKNGNAKNRYALAGLLIRAIQ